MLDYLKEKRDAGFFKSLSGLMLSCRYVRFMSLLSLVLLHSVLSYIAYYIAFFSVLDLNAFERQKKAESLGMVTEEGSSKSMPFSQLEYKFFPGALAYAYSFRFQGLGYKYVIESWHIWVFLFRVFTEIRKQERLITIGLGGTGQH